MKGDISSLNILHDMSDIFIKFYNSAGKNDQDGRRTESWMITKGMMERRRKADKYV